MKCSQVTAIPTVITTGWSHEIELEQKPFKPFAPGKFPVHPEHEVKNQVEDILKQGITEKTESKFNSPVLLVKKPNGKHRSCVDFRKLNEITVNHVKKLPAVSGMFDQP